MTTETWEKHQKKIERLKQAKVSCMNNTKWRELFEAIEINEALPFPVVIKYLGSEQLFTQGLNKGINSTKNGTRDRDGGPVYFKEIEWIYATTVYEKEGSYHLELQSRFVERDILTLKKIIDNLGKFTYDFDENGLKIYGYK